MATILSPDTHRVACTVFDARGTVVGGWWDPDFAEVEDGLTVVDRMTLVEELAPPAPSETRNPLTSG
jgi:hypothetical protein